MRDLKLSNTHDIIIENDDLKIEKNREETIVQSLEIRLKMFYGEWYSNGTLGVPYFEILLGQKSNPTLVAGIIQAEIEKEPSIRTVTNISMQDDNRRMKITFKATTTTGEEINQTIEVGV